MSNKAPLRLAYVSGPMSRDRLLKEYELVTAPKTEKSTSQTLGPEYITQFMEYCLERDIPGLVVTTHDSEYYEMEKGLFKFVNVPRKYDIDGINYHFSTIKCAYKASKAIRKFNADLAFISEFGGYYSVYSYLKFFGVKLVAAILSTLWRPNTRGSFAQQLRSSVEGIFFYPFTDYVISESPRGARQARELSLFKKPEAIIFSPIYDAKLFANLKPVDINNRDPFVTYYVGRIHATKGVFDIVEIAQNLNKRSNRKFIFHICGDGAELEELNHDIVAKNLTDTVILHGHCNPAQVLDIAEKSHCSITPTRLRFIEGAPKTLIEAGLAGRPIVSSIVCPAIEFFAEATFEVTPESIEEYTDAIYTLATDPEKLNTMAENAKRLSQRFFDPQYSWKATMDKVIDGTFKNQ